MRRIFGLQSELILTTAMLVGAALLFGGFLLLHLTEQKLIEQQLNHVNSTLQLISRSLTHNAPYLENDRGQRLHDLLAGLDLDLEEWVLYDRFMKPVDGQNKPEYNSRRALLLAHQARMATGSQQQLDPPEIWLPFKEHSAGAINSAIALHDVERRFVGVVWFRFPLDRVQQQIASTRQLVFIYVLLYGLVLTVFGVVVLSRNVVRPVNRLREATALVAAGDLTAHVDVDGPLEITELGQSFNQMTDALRSGRDELLRSERMASIELICGMAHEIGNPLAAIIGYLEMLKVDIGDGVQNDIVRRSFDETSRIDRLIRDLLDYAAPGGAVADPVDLCEILKNTIQSLQNQAVFDGYSISMECPDGLPAVCINPHKLTQVLVNLISNARDASDAGATIFVSTTQDGNDVLISVRDQGAGINEETRAQIFDPFFSTKPEGEGRGLGLTICHRIVDEVGGRIEVVSETDRGSTFLVRFPINDGICA